MFEKITYSLAASKICGSGIPGSSRQNGYIGRSSCVDPHGVYASHYDVKKIFKKHRRTDAHPHERTVRLLQSVSNLGRP